jgi:hypothetical protein
MAQHKFADILEAADQLTLRDQEDLIHILQNRVREQKRAVILQDVKDTQQEFSEGKCQPITPEALMDELLA